MTAFLLPRPGSLRFLRSFGTSLLCLALLGSWPARGFEQAVWIGANSGNWSDPANWNLHAVPNNSADQEYRCIWDAPPVTITVDVPVTVISLTLWSGGTLNIMSDLHFTDGLSFRPGVITGTGTLQCDGSLAFDGDAAGNRHILDGFSVTMKNSSVLVVYSSLELRNRPGDGRLSHINILSDSRFTMGQPASILVGPEGTRSHIDNAGLVLLQKTLQTQADVLNHKDVKVEQTTLTLTNSDLIQDAGSLALTQGSIVNNSTDPDHGRVLIHGGSIGGSGHIDVARVGDDGGSPVTLSGQLNFRDVVVADATTFSVHLGGSAAGQFDNLSASQKLTWHPHLEVDFANGFENFIQPSDVFEIITPEAGAVVEGAFGNVAFGQRIKIGNFGTILVDHATANPAAVVLRDFRPVQFSVAINGAGNSTYYPLPVRPYPVMENAEIGELSTVDWTGGSLEFALTANYSASEDRLFIKPSGTGPGQISAVRDPGDATQMKISYGGTPFATGTGFLASRDASSGPTLMFHLEANATKDAIQALMRTCYYTNDVYGFEAFTNDLLRVFPQRTFQVTLTEPAGFHANDEAPIYLPKVLQIACIPDFLYITPTITKQIIAEAIFDNPERVESLMVGTQIHYAASCGNTPVTFTPLASNPSAMVVSIPQGSANEIDCDIVASVGSLSAAACLQIRLTAPWVSRCILDDSDADVSGGCTLLSSPQLADLRQPGLAAPAGSGPIALASFRALEALMNQTPEGRRLVELYWRHSTEWVAICIANTFGRGGMFAEVRGVLQRWQAYVNALLAGKGSGGGITQPMVTVLNQLWDHVLKDASAALKADMTAERDRFHGFQDFVGKNFNQWAEMLQIPVPTAPFIAFSHPRLDRNGFQAEANHVPGVNYSLLRSANLQDWLPAPGATIKTNQSTLNIADPNPPAAGGYYRLSLSSP